MLIKIDTENVAVLARVAEMVELLVENQGYIEHLTHGQIVIDYSPSEVKMKLPVQQLSTKIPRTKLTSPKT